MIKSELIDKLAKQFTRLPEKEVADIVNFIVEGLSDALATNQRIEIRGFGSFSLHYRPPRKAHNPKTKIKVITQPKYSPHFKPGKEMRDRVNENSHIPLKTLVEDDNSDD